MPITVKSGLFAANPQAGFAAIFKNFVLDNYCSVKELIHLEAEKNLS